MNDYFSESNFLQRLKEHSIDMSAKNNYKKFVILWENRYWFPEVKLKCTNAKDLFEVNKIYSLALLTKKCKTEFINTAQNATLVRDIKNLKDWIKEMIMSDDHAIEKLINSLPADYKSRFSEVLSHIAKEVEGLKSKCSACSDSQSTVKYEPADYYVKIIKNLC